ncbi:MAG: apolipoprotein N-acyltransferase [Nitrospinaceae bacterium]
MPWIFSTLSGLMLILIFPRFNLEFLAWFALVPLFFAIQDQPLPRTSLYGFWTGIIFYFFGLHWVTNTLVNYGNIPTILSYGVLLLLAAYLSLFLALFCYLVQRLARGNSLYFFLLAPPAWTAMEYLRSTHPEYGFSWLGLGYSQFKNLPVIQMAEFTGVYGISTLIVLVNAGIYFLLRAWIADGKTDVPKSQRVRVLTLTVLVLALWLGYGTAALNGLTQNQPGAPQFRVGLAQGNIAQGIKWNPLFRNQVMKTYRDLTLKAAQSHPDLVVWPEAAIPFYFPSDQKESGALREMVRTTGTPLLLGSPYREVLDGKSVYFNSAFLVDAAGKILGRYDKIHLVPFGEYVPFQNILWFINKLVVGIGDFGRGTHPTVFHLKDRRFGVSICYEITFPDLVRQPVKNGAEFLVNITNDAWFGRSAASYQHISMAALRAVENRVPIVRAANTGISGTIGPSGKIRRTTKLYEEDLVLTEISPKTSRPTYYSRYGDVFSYACILLTGILAVLARFSNKPS